MTTEREPVQLAWHEVGVTYGDRSVLRGVTLEALGRRILGLVGANGAGKTTLLNVAAGLLRPSAGDVRVEAGAHDADVSVPLGALIGDPVFYPWGTGAENLAAVCAGRAAWLARIPALLADAGIADAADRPVRTYSEGMRRRLAIARALLGKPSIVLLDEPTNGLDPSGVRWLQSLLDELRDRGVAVVVSSHVLSIIERQADDIAIVGDGRVLAAGPTSEVVHGSESLEDVYFRLAGSGGTSEASG